ncbi:MAG: Methylated-DNA--protein-cysteine methyltransferase, constitutive [Syntrophorhabdus sp. PtaB.Bin047]|nr:MAG: Methylated-DNA--protein-cysteine methyltransferase, constitutive [Syntrophorhabdus sp. PtaB.Bin047]
MDLIEFAIFESWFGTISVVKRQGRIVRLDLSENDMYQEHRAVLKRFPDGVESDQSFKAVRTLLHRYLKGQPVDFRDVEIDISDLPAFTRMVLEELRKIPYGETRSYLDIARSAGCPSGGRAVGQAVKRNPIPIIVPCHRVIRHNGSLGGFGLGEKIKKRLLSLEGVKKTWSV